MFIFKILPFLCSIILPLTCNSQQVLKGIVIDNDNEEPLSKASIKAGGNSEFAATNEAGSFKVEIPNISKFDTLVVTHVGYSNISKLLE